MNVIFHLVPPLPQTWPDSYNTTPWQLSLFDQQSMVATYVQSILTWPPHFQFAFYGPVYIAAVKAL